MTRTPEQVLEDWAPFAAMNRGSGDIEEIWLALRQALKERDEALLEIERIKIKLTVKQMVALFSRSIDDR